MPDKKYDLIFARNVFFFCPEQINQAKRHLQYLKPGGVMCVTFMVDDDPHVGTTTIDGTVFHGVSKKEIEEFMIDKNIAWSEDFSEEFPDFGENLKKWHVYQMIIRNK